MGFLCQQCNKTSQPRTRQNKITVEKREREYYSIIIVHKLVKKPRYKQYERKDLIVIDKLKKAGWKIVHEVFSKGHEIVRTKNICEDCNRKREKETNHE